MNLSYLLSDIKDSKRLVRTQAFHLLEQDNFCLDEHIKVQRRYTLQSHNKIGRFVEYLEHQIWIL